MGGNFFDDEDQGDFADRPMDMIDGSWQADQTHVQAAPAPVTESQKKAIQAAREAMKLREAQNTPQVQSPSPEEFVLEDAPELEVGSTEDEVEEIETAEILSNARLRLEQGRLYEMVLNHDLFSGLDADPRAVKSVAREIKKFARESMEIMLGMRQTRAMQQSPNGNDNIAIPFNDLEVSVLKRLASTATKGKTETAEANTIAASVKPKQAGLNSIGPVNSKPTPKPLAQKAAAPVSRVKPQQSAVAVDADANYKPLTKPVAEMTEQEKLDHNKAASLRQRQSGKKLVGNSAALPPPTFEQMQYLAEQQVMSASNSPAIMRITDIINKMPRK